MYPKLILFLLLDLKIKNAQNKERQFFSLIYVYFKSSSVKNISNVAINRTIFFKC